MSKNYDDFLASKRIVVPEVGFEPSSLPSFLYPFQRELVATSLRRGRSAMFEECGLGKTGQQLAWAAACAEKTGKPSLVLAPLAVAKQTVREGIKFNIPAAYAMDSSSATGPVVVTNYERLQAFDPSAFGAVVLDESSILKAYSGVTKRRLLEAFATTPYRLCCSATPAPNDHLELGNHSEFLSVLSSHQMIARWFINDTSTFGTYRLKGHAVEDFWDWVSSWAAMCALPSDVAPEYSDAGYVLPALETITHVVDVDVKADRGENLFRIPELSATSVHQERRRTATARAAKLAELVRADRSEAWIVWTETDYEADALTAALKGEDFRELRGSEQLARKEDTLELFSTGGLRVLITKPKIAGFGLNWQHCARVAFASATFSFESYYQAIRRCWRFGQTRAVQTHITMGATERGVVDVLNAKRAAFEQMRDAMMQAARRRQHRTASSGDYVPTKKLTIPSWLKSEVA
jgi:hypothetical protein